MENSLPQPITAMPQPRERQLTHKVFRCPGSSAGKAIHMKHHACASKQLIVLAGMALFFAPALQAAESSSRFQPDGKAGIERVPAPPAPSSDALAGAEEAQGQTSTRPSPVAAEPPTAKAPLVSYEDGQLTINAENSSLSDVMKAVRAALGADIDLPPGVADQPIWVHLGPGPASRILRDLLDSTEFNYVIQAAENDPDGIRSVLLTPRSKSTGPEMGPAGKPGVRWMPGHGPGAANAAVAENPPSEPAAPVDPSQAPPSQPAASADASQAPPSEPSVNATSARLQNTPTNFDSSAMRPSPTSDPTQQIQQLQSLYEQRRQLQMQQNQKPAGQN